MHTQIPVGTQLVSNNGREISSSRLTFASFGILSLVRLSPVQNRQRIQPCILVTNPHLRPSWLKTIPSL